MPLCWCLLILLTDLEKHHSVSLSILKIEQDMSAHFCKPKNLKILVGRWRVQDSSHPTSGMNRVGLYLWTSQSRVHLESKEM